MTRPDRNHDLDRVIADLRVRLDAPDRRTDHPVSIFSMKMREVSVSGMMEQARELSRLVPIIADTRTTDPEKQIAQADAHRLAQQLHAEMQTPAETPLQPTASEGELEVAELALGLELPASMRRIYAEVANGGFGPCQGLLGLPQIVRETMHMRRSDPDAFPFEWPADLIVIEAPSPYSHNLNVRTGEIVAFDGDPIAQLDWDEATRDELRIALERSFEVVAPNLESWLGAWIAGPDPEELADQEEALASSLADAKAHWRAQVEKGIIDVGKKSAEARRAMGLPDVGWGDEMRRGAGVLDPD